MMFTRGISLGYIAGLIHVYFPHTLNPHTVLLRKPTNTLTLSFVQISMYKGLNYTNILIQTTRNTYFPRFLASKEPTLFTTPASSLIKKPNFHPSKPHKKAPPHSLQKPLSPQIYTPSHATYFTSFVLLPHPTQRILMKYICDEVNLHSIPIFTKAKEKKLDYTVNKPIKNIENFEVEYALHSKKKM
jgi:hypothetical protein